MDSKHLTRTLLAYLMIGLLPLASVVFPAAAAKLFRHDGTVFLVSYGPVIGLVLLGVLGWKINQTRILWVAAILLLIHVLVRWPGALPFDWLVRRRIIQAACIGLPVSYLILFLGKESPIMDQRTIWRVILALSPFILLASIASLAPKSFAGLLSWRIALGGRYLAFPNAGLLTWLPFLAASVFLGDQRIRPFIIAVAATVIPSILAGHLALRTTPEAGISPNLAAAAATLAICAILLYSILSMYWQRVYLDELTEIPNRRALEERLHSITGRFSLAMIDIDNFKSFNDTYGHDEGDNVLRYVARHLTAEFGKGAFRYGGEEFCVIFDGMKGDEAFPLMDAARRKLAQRFFHIRTSGLRHKRDRGRRVVRSASRPHADIVRITLSAGLASTEHEADAATDEVVKNADDALYLAKTSGRNRVIEAK